MRLMHINGQVISRYKRNEMTDLIKYLEPEITLTSNSFGGTDKNFEKVNQYETIHLDHIKDYLIRNIGEETLVIIKNVDKINKIDFNKFNGKFNIITDQIKEETDFSSFKTSLNDNGLIKELKKYINNINLFSTKLPANKERKFKDKTIYGIDLPTTQYGKIKIPLIKTGKPPQILLLPSEKVGMQAITDMGEEYTTKLKRKGIKSRKDLCQITPRELMKHEGIGPYRGTKWITSAKAIENQEIYKIKENNLKDKHRIFIDIETDSLRPEIIWHIGLYDDKNQEYTKFLEKKPKNKGRIIKDFMNYLKNNQSSKTILLAWYGKKFDFKILEKFIKEYAPKFIETWRELKKIDFMEWTKKHSAIPCRNQKLEQVSIRTNFKTEKTGLNGEKVGKMYTKYMNNQKKELNWEKLKKYGKNDVMGMKHIYDKIEEASMPYNIDEIRKTYRKTNNKN